MHRTTTGTHPSLWVETSPLTSFPKLTTDLEVDVAIVGGGIAGVTAAAQLRRAGASVAIVDAGRIGEGETGNTSAHLATHHDLYYRDTISRFGLEGATLAAQSRMAAIDTIEAFSRSLSIPCSFERVPAYLYTDRDEDVESLYAEEEACRRVGVACSFVSEVPLPFQTVGALRFDRQAQFHPRRYLLALLHSLIGPRCRVFESTRVHQVESGSPCRVVTSGNVITAKQVIVATNVPINNRVFLITKLASYRSYVIGARVPASFAARALFWDTLDPYHYVRMHALDDGMSLLIVGGEDHKTGTEDDPKACFSRLEEWTRARFPVTSIDHRWSGQIVEPADGLPYIGHNALESNVFVATGFSGDGLTNGTLAGVLLADQILGRDNPWGALYAATRVKPLASVKEFVSENVDFPAHFVGDLFKSPQARSVDEVHPGDGKLVRVGSKRLAVYREPNGALHAFSPACPHMGCFVKFNGAEKSWDCPCHGSRFACDSGQVLNGPATHGLAPRELDESPRPSRISTAPRDSRDSII